MRVFVFVAALVGGASVCFAARLRARQCEDLDTADTNPLCTPLNKAYAVPKYALSPSVAHRDNESNTDTKDGEARGFSGFSGMKRAFEPDVPTDWIKYVKARTDTASHSGVTKIEFLIPLANKQNPRDRFYQIQILADKFWLPKHLDPELLNWFEYIQAYRDQRNARQLDFSPFDNEELLKLLMEKIKSTHPNLLLSLSQPNGPILQEKVLHHQLVDLFEHLRTISNVKSLAEDVLRYMVLDSRFNALVYEKWLGLQHRPKEIFAILLGAWPNTATLNTDNALFTAWLRYVNKYWDSTYDARYFDFINFLSSFTTKKEVRDLVLSNEFAAAFPSRKGSRWSEHIIELRRVARAEIWLENKTKPNEVFAKLMISDTADSDNLTLLRGLDYVNQYRLRAGLFTDKELYQLLSNKRTFEEVVKLLRKLSKLPKFNQLAVDMFKSLSTSGGVLKVLADQKVDPANYWKFLITEANGYDIAVGLQWLKYATVYDRQTDKQMQVEDSLRKSVELLKTWTNSELWDDHFVANYANLLGVETNAIIRGNV